MTDYIHQAALIVPATQLDAARRIAGGLGWGAGCYSCSLAGGTYWGLSTVITQSFVDMLAAAGTGTVPEGVDPADIAAVLPALLSSIEPAGLRSQLDQFEALCSANALTRDEETQE
ncbi:hypothetical protein [Salipiger sp.]|uniref:hypothetical protein n=1 Tax=Salipiger sp. TaxID=2078585 RepID=UPI003A97995A